MLHPSNHLRDSVKKLSSDLRRLSSSESRKGENVQMSSLDRIAPWLDGRRVPMNAAPTVSDQEAIELALSSIDVLVAVLENMPDLQINWERALGLWPSFWKWCLYLLPKCEEKPGDSLLETLSSKHIKLQIGRTIKAWTTNEFTQKAVVDTPKLLENAAHYWMEEETAERGLEMGLWTCTLGMLLSVTLNLDEVLYASNGPRNLARMAVKRLRLQMENSNVDMERICDCLTLLQYVLRNAQYEMPMHLKHAGLIRHAIGCLNLFKNKRPSDTARWAVNLALNLIQNSCTCLGATCAIQALDGGAIQAYLGCAKFVGTMVPAHAAGFIAFLPNCFVPHLAFRRVVSAAAKQLKTCSHAAPLSGPLRKPWLEFKTMVETRKEIKDGFQSSYKGQYSACLCKVAYLSRPLRKCSNCNAACYCSYACQRDDWPRHKQVCRLEPEDRRAQGLDKITMDEKLFIRAIVTDEIKKRRSEVDTCLKRIAKSQDKILQINLQTAPPLITTLGGFQVSAYELVGVDKREQDLHRLLLQVISRVGAEVAEMFDTVILPDPPA